MEVLVAFSVGWLIGLVLAIPISFSIAWFGMRWLSKKW